jgi:hypothetical protein
MKEKGKHGGQRPNSGPKVSIERELMVYNVALNNSFSVDWARRMLRESGGSPKFLLSAKRIRKLRKIALLPDAKEYLTAVKQFYQEHRWKWGFKT